MKLKSFTIITALFTVLLVSAQINLTQHQKIDSLFVEWDKPNHPGGVVGIMENDKIVFSKAYGFASLEYLVPNSTETIFNTASVSKQFSAMGIILLHQQGKLSIDDDIRKHLDWLPKFKETITIRHLLHHTSGLRSLHSMLGLAGWRGDDLRTNKDLNRFMKNQRDLNFKPGDEYLYCNTGFMFLSDIIENVTGKPFTVYMKDSVFEPLGMHNTYVEDKYNRVVLNNATSYNNSKINEFEREIEYWGYIGSGNMHSTTTDLLKWLSNFYNPKHGWENSFKMMQKLDNLNNGAENNYAFGVIIDKLNGVKRIHHGGSIGGFRSYIACYPDQKLSIAILTNFSTSSPKQKAEKVTGLLVKNENTIIKDTNKNRKIIKLSKASLQKYVGHYWTDKVNRASKIELVNDTLRYVIAKNNYKKMLPISSHEFLFQQQNNTIFIKFISDIKGDYNMIIKSPGNKVSSAKSYEPTQLNSDNMNEYSGLYYSSELETNYSISIKNNKLFCHHVRHGDIELKLIKKDVLEGEWPVNIVKFNRDNNGNINGIYISNGRVRNLWLEKSSKK